MLNRAHHFYIISRKSCWILKVTNYKWLWICKTIDWFMIISKKFGSIHSNNSENSALKYSIVFLYWIKKARSFLNIECYKNTGWNQNLERPDVGKPIFRNFGYWNNESWAIRFFIFNFFFYFCVYFQYLNNLPNWKIWDFNSFTNCQILINFEIEQFLEFDNFMKLSMMEI